MTPLASATSTRRRRRGTFLNATLIKIQKLVLDMLKLSKDQPPHRQPCQLNRLVETVVQMLRPQADERQIGITLQTDEHLGLLSLDPDQMQDVVMNLLLNAIEAVPQQTGQVAVHTELDRDAKTMVLRVSDNGKGIEIHERFLNHSIQKNRMWGRDWGFRLPKKSSRRIRVQLKSRACPAKGRSSPSGFLSLMKQKDVTRRNQAGDVRAV